MLATTDMKQARIYLDNAASTPMYPEVIQEMTKLMTEFYGNPSAVHFYGRHAKNTIEEARKIIATGLGASQGEIFFTSGGTEANNTALKCAVRDLGVRRIITSPTEHHSVLQSCQRLKDQIDLEFIDVDHHGRPSLAHLEQLLEMTDDRTLVSLMHGNNEVGTMIDLQTFGTLIRSHRALFHTDAVQTVAHFPIRLNELNVDFLSASAHKFHGPKGVGILYINAENAIQPLIDGGSQERNMRAGTENIAGIRAMATAFQLSGERMPETASAVRQLKNYTAKEIKRAFPESSINGDSGEASLYTVLNITFPESANSQLLLLHLDIEGISTSGGSACSSGATKGSHVLQAMQVDPNATTIRVSFSEFNTREEVDQLIEKLVKILQ